MSSKTTETDPHGTKEKKAAVVTPIKASKPSHGSAKPAAAVHIEQKENAPGVTVTAVIRICTFLAMPN